MYHGSRCGCNVSLGRLPRLSPCRPQRSPARPPIGQQRQQVEDADGPVAVEVRRPAGVGQLLRLIEVKRMHHYATNVSPADVADRNDLLAEALAAMLPLPGDADEEND